MKLTRREACRGICATIGVTYLAGCATSESTKRRRAFRDRGPLPARPGPSSPLPTYSLPDPSPSVPAADVWRGEIIARNAWTNKAPRIALADPMRGISRITIHHDGMSRFTATSPAEAMGRIELIRRSHVNKGWADIGYHYIIDPAGRVYEGRPIALQGAHVKHHNPNNLGVMVLGNYNLQAPTPAAQRTLTEFVGAQTHRYAVPRSRVFTHRELRPTECPGASLQAFIEQARRSSALA